MPPSFDEIFAIRLSLQDYVTDEYTIIKRLKIILQDYNMQLDEINQYIVDFYNSFGLMFTLEEIQEINVEANNLLSIFITNGDIQMTINENDPNENINITNLLDNIIYNSNNDSSGNIQFNNLNNQTANNITNLPTFISDIQNIIPQNMILGPELNIFNTLVNFINNTPHFNHQQATTQEDVLVTMDEEEVDNLIKEVVIEKQPERCTICLQDIDKDEHMIKLKCSHYYHAECITKYLKEFDYKCPICRENIGNTHVHI